MANLCAYCKREIKGTPIQTEHWSQYRFCSWDCALKMGEAIGISQIPSPIGFEPLGVIELAKRIRRHVLEMTHKAQSSHVGSCLSVADILAVLYSGVLNVRPEEPDWDDRDRLILSKGHACAALYAVLAEGGFFPIKDLDMFYQKGSKLAGHVSHEVAGVDVSTGALGHGLSIGCGMAWAAKKDKKLQRIFVILSDGDCDEGSTWEAAMFADQHSLDNLIVIIDYNRLQAMGFARDILDLTPLVDKWSAFGWSTTEIDGHDYGQLNKAFGDWKEWVGYCPRCIIARTIKGKGVGILENKVESHYKYLNDEELKRALEELHGSID